ncbi:MAG TPA: chorismate synthase [Catalimonadaceae bacterium]|jgi:chorismate synthase|nr:chorismate synthase [Catalimonadaceae bacterium]
MSNNSYGKVFTISTFGESHGPGIGVVIDGCPAGLELDTEQIRTEMQRRKPGQSRLTTQRKEEDEIQILSGVFEGKTTGTPLCIFIPNENQKPKDYAHIAETFRPSHADYTYQSKYGIRDYRGGGRSSARETAARVAAGAVARQILATAGIKIQAYVQQVGYIKVEKTYQELNLEQTESNDVRCPDPDIALQMEALIDTVRKEKDTIGGLVRCVCSGVPVGLGEPVFDKLHAELGKAMLSINAVKGFQIGSGFSSLGMRGSEHNDEFYTDNGVIHTRTNHSGGVQGGISNGEDIYFDVAFKPVATIMQDQNSVDADGNPVIVEGKGRHDPCVLPRAVPIVEAMAALVLVDFWLRNRMTKL